MLGYMEQTPLYNAINFNIVNRNPSGGAYVNHSLSASRIATFLCPSAPVPLGTIDCTSYMDGGCSYFASVGPSLAYQDYDYNGSPPNGIFKVTSDPRDWGWGSPGGPVGIRDITDGTSNTIAFGEWRIGDFNSNQFTNPSDVINPVAWLGGPYTFPNNAQVQTLMQWLNNCAAAGPGSINHSGNNWEYNMSYLGANWDQGMFGYTLGNTLLAPNPQYPNCRTCGWFGDWDCPGMYGLSSFHPGGGNIAFADGSVRFLKASTAMNVVWALGTKAGGETISSDQY
jgi:prepilin-type processing-associated H-X9-DG protein